MTFNEKIVVMLQWKSGKKVYRRPSLNQGDHSIKWVEDSHPDWDWKNYIYSTNLSDEKPGTIVCENCEFFMSSSKQCFSNFQLIYTPETTKRYYREVSEKNRSNNCTEFKEKPRLLKSIQDFFTSK